MWSFLFWKTFSRWTEDIDYTDVNIWPLPATAALEDSSNPFPNQWKDFVLTKASQVVLVLKKPPTNAGDIRDVGSLGWEGSLQKGMATHSSIIAWRIPVDKEAW